MADLPAAESREMFRIKVTYASGYADLGECTNETEAREAVSAATLRMIAGVDGITDVACWEVAE